jgi:hypothetical protein
MYIFMLLILTKSLTNLLFLIANYEFLAGEFLRTCMTT